MSIIDLAAITNLVLIGYLVFTHSTQKTMSEKALQALKHISGFAVAWGAFSTLTGLFEAFRWLENAKEMVSYNIFFGGMRVAVISTLYGLIVYLISLVSYIALSIIKKN